MSLVRRAAAAALVALMLAGCSSTVSVDTFVTEPDTETNCRALVADLPRSVLGQEAELVTNNLAAAWGDPAIILRCGVEKPADLTATSRCDRVGDVDWLTETTADGFLFTTIGRTFHVSIEVPAHYDPAADALVDLAPSVRKHDPEVKPCV